MQKLGLIAGGGTLPVEIAEHCRRSGRPLFVIRLDGLITKFMGETAAKLRIVFDALRQTKGLYFFDEVDALVLAFPSERLDRPQ